MRHITFPFFLVFVVEEFPLKVCLWKNIDFVAKQIEVMCKKLIRIKDLHNQI